MTKRAEDQTVSTHHKQQTTRGAKDSVFVSFLGGKSQQKTHRALTFQGGNISRARMHLSDILTQLTARKR